MAEEIVRAEDIQLFPPDDSSGQYGRDFYHPSIGFARIQLVNGKRPAASVEFLDLEGAKTHSIGADSRVDLIDAIAKEETVRGLAWAAIVMGAHEVS